MKTRKSRTAARLGAVIYCWLIPVACTTSGESRAAPEDDPDRVYEVVFTATLKAGEPLADVSIRTGRNSRLLRELRFRFNPERYSGFGADGNLQVDDRELVWRPPRAGGELRYQARVSHRRRSGSYDALVADDWAIFRGDDLFPAARTRVVAGSRSRSRLELNLPDGWSAVTPYLSGVGDLTFDIDNPARGFDRPTGWILTGEIGVRRGLIAERRVAIAGPTGQNLRRMDIMAFLRWTLPGVVAAFPSMDERLVIIGAGDPMWRGGLSGPGSMFVHADRPMISENGTSTFLHELVHVAMGVAGSQHDDWLVEGLAEYYSIKILRTTGSLANRRLELTLEELREWGSPVDNLFVRNSTGPVTARAVTLLAELDAYLQERTRGRRSLDTAIRYLIEGGGVYDYAALCTAARRVTRRPAPVLDPARVPGAPDVAACRTKD